MDVTVFTVTAYYQALDGTKVYAKPAEFLDMVSVNSYKIMLWSAGYKEVTVHTSIETL